MTHTERRARQPLRRIQISWKARRPQCLRITTTLFVRSVRHAEPCIRGLLCEGCNTGLGAFEGDLNRLQSAIDYVSVTARVDRRSAHNVFGEPPRRSAICWADCPVSFKVRQGRN
ncbi:endonuclease domain-containing protein [Streptomyces rimosus]|uniref:endonuclease domain-containing protein n=1 Tax=Streptomyces rimosus TaxID=1927 RepID=UPI00099BA7F7